VGEVEEGDIVISAVGTRLSFVVLVCLALVGCVAESHPGLVNVSNISNVSLYVAGGACHSENGMPDPRCTPGAVSLAVTQDNINDTICKPNYSASIRPSSGYTNMLKRLQLGIDNKLVSGVGVYDYTDKNMSNYEEDHLIPLSLGGDPMDVKNLWPEYGDIPNDKDKVENICHRMVCNGSMTLVEAQQEIVANWHIACGGTGYGN